MAHRGKLELLTCILGFPPAKIFGKVSEVRFVFQNEKVVLLFVQYHDKK
jgi:2-oxoglutarate dehydrogenase complex dehydrogenase (E1) component-like enzyme